MKQILSHGGGLKPITKVLMAVASHLVVIWGINHLSNHTGIGIVRWKVIPPFLAGRNGRIRLFASFEMPVAVVPGTTGRLKTVAHGLLNSDQPGSPLNQQLGTYVYDVAGQLRSERIEVAPQGSSQRRGLLLKASF